jgi:hypothetical protein
VPCRTSDWEVTDFFQSLLAKTDIDQDILASRAEE